MKKSYYVTTPIYYVNDVPHIGHAYTTIATDVMARFKRWTNHEVFFLTGTDEHGQKVEKAAKEKGRTPKSLADEMVKRFQELWKRLDITNNHFVRTTDDYHARVVQEFFSRLLESGDIYLGEYEGWYCTPCETYWLEDELGEGMICPDCGRPTERLKEPSYFFKLSKYQEPLLKFYQENPEFVRPQSRMNEIVSFVSGGLNDISISRTNFSWGIPVPGDPKHVIYVWFDALFNYLSGLGYGWNNERYQQFWPADVHFIGKDILRFHAVFWPAFLMAAGMPLPKRVFAHGWWTVEGRKMSKSLRNVVDPHLLIDLYGADALRYFLLREVSFGFDGDFSHRAMAHRVNGDLANDLGNLFYRSLSMEMKYFKGEIPQPSGRDQEISSLAEAVVKDVVELMEMQEFKKSLERIWDLVKAINKYIDTKAPWQLAKEKREQELKDTIYTMLEGCRVIALLISPFMPNKAQEMWKQLGMEGSILERSVDDTAWGGLPAGQKVKKGDPLFPRIDEEKMVAKVEKMLAKAEKGEVKAEKKEAKAKEKVAKRADGLIDISEFAKVKLVVALIEKAERVPKSEKLVKLQVDVGTDRRTIVAGIGKDYSPEELVGKRVIVVANLKPAKLMGIESKGMLIAAVTKEGVRLPIIPEDVPPGTEVH